MSRSVAGGKRATIRDVALRAGVSVGTVSHVLNSAVRVRPETRAAVEEAIANLNFTPHLVARMLIGRRGRAGVAWQPDTPRLTAIGYLSADYIARICTLPHREDRVAADRIDKTLGGTAANVAVAAAGLGEPFPVAADLLTKIGDDADSDWAVSLLGARGVETVALAPRNGHRLGRGIILMEANGARTLLHEDIKFPEEAVVRQIRRMGKAAGPHVVHWQGALLSTRMRGRRLARELGYVVSTQTAGAPPSALADGRLAAIIAEHDLVFLDRESARIATGWQGSDRELVSRVERATRGMPQRVVTLTLADTSTTLFADGARVHAPAPPVDDTSTGDTFVGVFLATWLNGAPLEAATRYAVAAASRSMVVTDADDLHLTAADLQRLMPSIDIASLANSNPIGVGRHSDDTALLK